LKSNSERKSSVAHLKACNQWSAKERARKRRLGLCVHSGCQTSVRVQGGRCPTHKRYQRDACHQAKLDALAAYGGACFCCGETDDRLLSIDHKNNNGYLERKRGISSGHNLYCSLRKRRYPKEYQAACFNCNIGRAINGGTCPHQDNRRKK
jgi:hypothetical protein